MIRTTSLLLLLLTLAFPAFADDYTKPTWPDLVRTLVRFNAIPLNDDNIIDDYALIAECPLYKSLYSDDFKWAKARAAIRESMRLNVATYPTSYAYVSPLQLGRYDFQDNLYRFTDKTTMKNVNAFMIYKAEGMPCGTHEVKYLPSTFRIILDAPFYFEGLPLSSQDAEALLQRMNAVKNTDHVIYASFNMRIVYIEPLRASHMEGESRDQFSQSNATDKHVVRLDAHLDSIDFFEDEAMTRLVYRYQP